MYKKITAEEKQRLLDDAAFLFEDRVWCNGRLYREDFLLTSEQGTSLKQEFLELFPEESYVVSDNSTIYQGLIGTVDGGVREPYTDKTYSIYPIGEELPDHVIETFKPEEWHSYGTIVKPWWGFKYNAVTKEKQFKVAYYSHLQDTPPGVPMPPPVRIEGVPPEVWPKQYFFGKIYLEGGEVHPLMDYYVHCSEEEMREYCRDNNLAFPYPDDYTISTRVLWGIVYNCETMEVTLVKAYENLYF